MITRSEKPIYPIPIRWTRDEYDRLGESGVFGERRVELLEGAIIETITPVSLPGVAVAVDDLLP